MLVDKNVDRGNLSLGVVTDEEKGRIVYSTCSFNPVENEAVIAAVLNSVPGTALDRSS